MVDNELEDRLLLQAIFNTIPDPVLVLDGDLRVVVASRSFYRVFRVNRQDVQGRMLCALGDGQWNIPRLLVLLAKVLPERFVLEGFQVTHEFSGIGRRTVLLKARKLFYEDDGNETILLVIEDITDRLATEQRVAELMRQKEVLLDEMRHRIANSLQIIASILLLKAQYVQSEETRAHLRDAHSRVMSVASVQQQLRASETGDEIKVGDYLKRLCETLAASMITDDRPVAVTIRADVGSVSSTDAVSLGLIVTELFINALKHAFPVARTDCKIVVTYDVSAGGGWTMAVSDNGIGNSTDKVEAQGRGLGSSLVTALAQQLSAHLEIISSDKGRTVRLTHDDHNGPVTA